MKLRSIELLRGLAALSVAVAHSDSLIGGNADLPFAAWHSFKMPGTAGVEFFFVLSGFVMAIAHGREIAEGGHVGRFLWKRFCRIYPLYWIVLAIPLYRFWGAPLLTPGAILAWCSLLPIRTDNLLVVAWTLRQEVTFYLVLALCLIPRIGRYVLLAWVGVTVAWWTVVPQTPLPTMLNAVMSPFDFEFFAGLGAGWLMTRWPAPRGVARLILGAGIAGLAWRMGIDGWGVEYGPTSARPLYGAAYAAIILGCASLERSGALRFGPRGTAIAAMAGALSYPLYLSHLLTLDAVAHWIGPSGWAARIGPDGTFVLMLSMAVLASAALAVAIDQPVQRLLRSVGHGKRSGIPVPG